MLAYLIIGFTGGLLSGLLGVGGGVIFVPLLTYLTKVDFKTNTGISSLAVVFVATASSLTYIFNDFNIPDFLRFSPGANFIVPKENILLRSKNFYKNLIKFINYSKLSCESHYLERSLNTIFNSNVQSSSCMDNEIKNSDLIFLEKKCSLKISKEHKFAIKIKNLITIKLLYFIYKILKLFK